MSTVHPVDINESPSLSTIEEATRRTQTVGKGDGEKVGSFEAEYDGDAETDAVGLGEAAVEADTEGVGLTDFVGDGDADTDAIKLRDAETERLSDLVMEGEMLPIVPAKW